MTTTEFPTKRRRLVHRRELRALAGELLWLNANLVAGSPIHTACKLYSKAGKLSKCQSNYLLCAVQLPNVCALYFAHSKPPSCHARSSPPGYACSSQNNYIEHASLQTAGINASDVRVHGSDASVLYKIPGYTQSRNCPPLITNTACIALRS